MVTNTLAKSEIPAADRAVSPSDNNPPLISADNLTLEHEALLARVGELESDALRQPSVSEDDEMQGQIQDVIKEIDKTGKLIETTREGVKAPLLAATRTVDGFFKSLWDSTGKRGRLDVIRAKLASTATNYLRKKEADARREREAESARLRKIEEDQRALARKAEEDAAKLREKHRPSAAVEKETVADVHLTNANVTAQSAQDAEQAAAAKPADLSRTRSGAGSLGTLAAIWGFEIENIDLVPASALWPYIPRAVKETAIKAYVKQNAPGEPLPDQTWDGLPGVRVFGTTRGQFR
jgi:hypothetical protein